MNTIDPFFEPGGVARIALVAGRARSPRARSRAETFIEVDPETRLSVITNFDEWEILYKDYSKGPDAEIRRRAQNAGLVELGEAIVALKAPGVFALNWNIYGVDIDPRAVEICSVSLMIQVIEELVRPLTGEVVRFPTIMGENIKRGNSVLCDLPNEDWRGLFAGKEKEIAELVALRKKIKETHDDETRMSLRQRSEKKAANISNVFQIIIDRKYHPLNWPLEFPEVFFGPQEGFAAVIGNPPYADIRDQFPPDLTRHRYKTTDSGDLYTLMIENILHLTSPTHGHGGMIVPLSLTFSRDMISLREVLRTSNRAWKVSSYASRPSSVFPGVEQRVSIVLMSPSVDNKSDTPAKGGGLMSVTASKAVALLTLLFDNLSVRFLYT